MTSETLPQRAADMSIDGGGDQPEQPQTGAELLDAVVAFLRRFIVYPDEHALVAHALWVAHTHRMDRWDSTPRLAFMSAEPGSGKTRALEITELLVSQPVLLSNVTPAYLFRRVASPDGPPTLLLDEIDVLLGKHSKSGEEIRGLINAGYKRSGKAGRCDVVDKRIEPREYAAYCAVCIGGIGELPTTIQARAVVIEMRRRAPGAEPVSVYRARESAEEGHALRQLLSEWLSTAELAIPDLPEGIESRDAEVWEALIAIADEAGGAWPERARVTAVTFVTLARKARPSLGVRLLADLQVVFGDSPMLPTAAIVQQLCSLEESPWGDLDGRPLDGRRLARMLASFGIAPATIRFPSGTAKGYSRASFGDAWARYLGEGTGNGG